MPKNVSFTSPIYIGQQLDGNKPSCWESRVVNSAEFVFNFGKDAHITSPKTLNSRSISKLPDNKQSPLWNLWQAVSLVASIILFPVGFFLLKVKYAHHNAVLGSIKKEPVYCDDSLKNFSLPDALPKEANYAMLCNIGSRPDLSASKYQKIFDSCNPELPTIVIYMGIKTTPLLGESQSFVNKGLYMIYLSQDENEKLIENDDNHQQIQMAHQIVSDDKIKPRRLIPPK